MSWILAALIVCEVIVIVVGGVLEGGWMLGLLCGGVGIRALYDWARMRRGNTPASTVAGNMLLYIAIVLFGLCLPAWDAIEVWMASS